MTIGERMAILRQNRGLSQEDVAKKIHISREAIYKYEKGIVTNIPLNRIEEIADVLGVTPAYLMGWEGDNHGIIGCPNSNNTVYNDNSLSPIQKAIIETVRVLSNEDTIRVLTYATELASKGDKK